VTYTCDVGSTPQGANVEPASLMDSGVRVYLNAMHGVCFKELAVMVALILADQT